MATILQLGIIVISFFVSCVLCHNHEEFKQMVLMRLDQQDKKIHQQDVKIQKQEKEINQLKKAIQDQKIIQKHINDTIDRHDNHIEKIPTTGNKHLKIRIMIHLSSRCFLLVIVT